MVEIISNTSFLPNDPEWSRHYSYMTFSYSYTKLYINKDERFHLEKELSKLLEDNGIHPETLEMDLNSHKVYIVINNRHSFNTHILDSKLTLNVSNGAVLTLERQS